MGQMIKSKRQYRCSHCGKISLKWAGICSVCHTAGGIEEEQLQPVKARATANKRSLTRRSKNSERNIAKRMTEVDGPDPEYAKIATPTGRIGHITNIRADAISRTYLTENKNRILPGWVIKAWLLINQRAIDFHKHALLHLDPPNMPRDFRLNGETYKLETLAVITQSRHEELIVEERELEHVKEILSEPETTNLQKVIALKTLLGV